MDKVLTQCQHKAQIDGKIAYVMLTEAEVTEIKSLLIQLSREILLQGTYQRKISSCLVILSKRPAL
ncbi:hypothetical protein C7B76_22795 [filamentous cyanobacterium CCP2]|jgi:hypothetical protein|nr:hypothetical protein C7B76_22795 [filamentous cyanobacterium CCP2]